MATVEPRKGDGLHEPPAELRERERWLYEREPQTPEKEQKLSMRAVSTAFMAESIGGFIAGVFCILALAGVESGYMSSIAAIVLGITLLIEAGSLGARFRRLPKQIRASDWALVAVVAGGIVALIAGASGVVFGLLALWGLGSVVNLLAVATLVFSVALILGTGLVFRLNSFERELTPSAAAPASSVTSISGGIAAGFQVILGLAGMMLAIHALAGNAPFIVSTIGLLLVSLATFFTGTVFCTRSVVAMRQW